MHEAKNSHQYCGTYTPHLQYYQLMCPIGEAKGGERGQLLPGLHQKFYMHTNIKQISLT